MRCRALDAATTGVDATDDAVAPVLALQAKAEVLRSLGDDQGGDATQAEVDERADVLDLDPRPWQNAFRLAARGAGFPETARALS